MYFIGMLQDYIIKMSHLHKLPDDPLINILLHLLCEPYALCQEYHELQTRGFNMQLGNIYTKSRSFFFLRISVLIISVDFYLFGSRVAGSISGDTTIWWIYGAIQRYLIM